MANDLIPTPEEIRAIELIVKNAVDSTYFNKQGGVAGAFSIAMYAREMGLPIMNSIFGGIRSVLGRVEIAPQLMNAMIRKAGHTIRVTNHTIDSCTVYGKRKDTGEEMTVIFTIEDAKRAKLFKPGGAWETYPKNMTFKSAFANLARWLFADVIGMAMVEGEVQEKDEEGEEEKRDDKPQVALEIPAEPSEADLHVQFKEKFKSIENMDFDLNDFVNFTAEKSKKPQIDTIKQAIKNSDRFSKAYLKWVEEQIPDEEISAVEVQKPMASLV